MLRALRFVIIAAILLGLAWGIGNIPGTITAHSGPYTLQTSVPAAILLFLLLLIVVLALLWLVGRVRRTPGGIGNWRSGRRLRLGDTATQRGIVALAAGDAPAAQAEAARARKLLGDTPLVLLLTAESARLSGRPEQAQAAFQKLTRHKDMAFLGHRGLLRQQLAGGDHEAAAAHALAAEDAYPGSAWLKTKRLDIALKKQDFRAALALARAPAEIAALATAASVTATSASDAFAYAKQAVKAAPALAPAIVAYARALRQSSRERAARQGLVKGWALAPHPLIATAYLEKITSPIERAQAAAELAKVKPGHPESELLLAETSLAAQLTGEARRHAMTAIAAGLADKRPYAVLASLEPNTETITSAANAPAAKWSCGNCFTEVADWAAICPGCGKAGTLAWNSGGRALAVAPGQDAAA